MENLVMALKEHSACIDTTNASKNRVYKIAVRGFLAGLLVSIFGLASCMVPAPGKTPTPPTTTIETSPLGATPPDTAESPLALPTRDVISSPLPTGTPDAASPSSAPSVDADFNLAQMALTPSDMSDLFQAGYSVQQEYQRAGMRGLQVLYPTSVVPHTTGFAEGFETRVEVYDQVADAHAAFNAATTATSDSTDKVMGLAAVGEESRVTVTGVNDRNESVLPDASGITRFVYSLIVRDGNVLLQITIKAPASLSSERLEQIMKGVVGKLTAIGS
jgi:hypothetical protein